VGVVFKVLGTLLLVGLCTGALLCCFAAVYINEVIVPLADLSLDDFTYNENSYMYYQDKTTGEYVEMTRLLSTTKSVWIDLEDMPDYLVDATVAIEDKRFWTHPGVDWRGTAKAVLRMFTGGEISGGSTITQQLIKNLTDYKETTVKRKITEIVRAFRVTQNNSKEDTIEYYLNIIPLGSGCEGVGAAALEYFGKPVSQLTLAESASLVGITNNPSKYGPYSFARSQGVDTDEIWDARQWNKYRQEVILYQMLDQGKITREEYDEAVAQELVFVRAENSEAESEIYTWYEETVISDVREALKEQYEWSDKQISQMFQRGGLRIYTCFDPDAQAIVDEVYTNRENLNYTSKNGQLMQSSITVIDNATRNVVAIAGQFGEKKVNLGSNYANGDGDRQPGSSFKPLAVYSPALEFGKISPISVLDDYPYDTRTGSVWPKNSGTTRYLGHVTVAEALKRSLNTVAVRIIADLVTPQESFDFVQERYHIDLEEGRDVNGQWKSDIDISPMAMGGLTDGTNTREMATAYATFPNGGQYAPSRTFTKVTRVVDGKEELLLDNTAEPVQVIKETTAYYMNTMLRGVFESNGTAAGHGLSGQRAAGKTGTTSDNFDRWFVGYTPYYTTAVWTGYERNYKMSLATNPPLVLWEKVMKGLHQGLENRDYPSAGSLKKVDYCLDSGLLATEWCAKDPRGSRVASAYVFPEDYPEQQYCTAHKQENALQICVDAPVLNEDGTHNGLYFQAGPYCPEASLREFCYPDYVREPVGSAVAGDEVYRYEHAVSYSQCPVHGTPPVVDPDPEDPDIPAPGPDDPGYVDPVDPGDLVDPGAGDPQ